MVQQFKIQGIRRSFPFRFHIFRSLSCHVVSPLPWPSSFGSPFWVDKNRKLAGETQDSRQTLLATKHAHWHCTCCTNSSTSWQSLAELRKLIFDDLHVFVHRDKFLSAMYLRPGSFKGLYRILLLRIGPASISVREWRCWYLRLQARAFQAKPNVANQDVKAGRYISGKGKNYAGIFKLFFLYESIAIQMLGYIPEICKLVHVSDFRQR